MPDGFDAIAEVVENVATLGAAAGGKETANDAGDMTTDVEGLGIVNTDALHTQAETADAGEDNCMSLT